MEGYLSIANSPMIWMSAIPVALIVVSQALIFSSRARKAAEIVDLSKEEANRAFKVGAIAAIGPSLGVFVVMLGLISVIGAPLSWMRLSIIGAAPAELTATQMAAKAQGLELTSPDYGLINFANAIWVMALNGSAWLLVSGLFSDKLDKVTQKLSGGNPRKIGILAASSICGAFSYLFANHVVRGLSPANRPILIAAVSGAMTMAILEKVGRKHKNIKEFSLGISMVIAMTIAVMYKKMVMGA